jgi:hypothetical protein
VGRHCLPVCVALLLLASTGAQSQSADVPKTLLLDRPLNDDPVRITKVMEGAGELNSDGHQYPNRYVWEATFKAGDDWLKNLTLVIKNVSEKKIIFVEAGCSLFETADWQSELTKHHDPQTPLVGSASNTVGRRPEQALYSRLLGHTIKPDTSKDPLDLAPGEELSIAIENPENYPALRSRIEERQPMSSLTACDGGISRIFFDDGTQWQAHSYLRADPERPGRWIRMSFEDWSGAKRAGE